MAKDKAKEAYDLAYKYEKEWRTCGQCTIKALLDVYNIDNKDLFRVLSGYGAGIAKESDGPCGAYVAGTIMLALKFGRDVSDIGVDPDDPRGSKKNRYLLPLIRKLRNKFEDNYNGIVCNQIHRKLYGRPYYVADKDEAEKFDLAGAHDWGCTSVCGEAAKWTVEIIDEALKNKK